MREYNLDFISNIDLYNHVKTTVDSYRFEINLAKFNRNLIDPIKLTFDSGIYGKTIQEVVESEVIRQIDKSNTNLIGYFHQNIFNYIGEGWSVPSKGWDIIHATDKKYVEMKNKHNTMNSSSSKNTYIRMQNELIKDSDATCMLVEVIAKYSQNVNWATTIDEERVSNDKIRRVSIDKFYELVTGNSLAFLQLCEAIPNVLQDVLEDVDLDDESNTVVEELEEISPNILKSIYLLSFRHYEGFENINV